MRARLFLVAAPVAASLAWGSFAASASTRPDGTAASGKPTIFHLFGSGFGHGVGLSQYGAYGLALDGWTAARILTHFYSGTWVAHAPGEPDQLRVGLVQGRKQLHLRAEAGKVELRLGQPNAGDLVGTIPDGATWTVGISKGQYRITNGKGDPVGPPVGGPAQDLFVRYQPLGSRVRLAEAGHAYAHGWIELNLYLACDGCIQHLRAVAAVPTEQYLYGLGEVPSEWPMAALQAQAIAARTYAVEKVLRVGQHQPGCNCGLYASTLDQVYLGWDKEAAPDGTRWVAAANATASKVVLFKGKPIQANYFSSSGGFTEDNENVWPGAALPYLRGVCDTGDYTPANPNRVWEQTFSAKAMGQDVAAATGTAVGPVRKITGVTRGVSGRIIQITVVGKSGKATLSGTEFRSALGLPDDRVWIGSNRNVTGDIRGLYDRLGCAPGLAASARLKLDGGAVQRFADGAIYRNDRAAVTVWVHGSIEAKYLALGEDRSVLGLPRTGVKTLPKLGGRLVGFDAGAIYFKAGSGTHELHGRVLDYFLAHGGAWKLGFPTTDVVKGKGGTLVATFDSGIKVTCPPGKPCTKSNA
jgi:stage II sporulation protein D